MLDKKWFEENKSFCTYDEYERGKERYIKSCVKKKMKEDFEELPLLIKILFVCFVFVFVGTIYCMITGKINNIKDDNYITRTASTSVIIR